MYFILIILKLQIKRGFELRIENVDIKEFSMYFNQNNFWTTHIKHFRKKKCMLISACNGTDSIGFLRSMVYKCISHEEKILMLHLWKIFRCIVKLKKYLLMKFYR